MTPTSGHRRALCRAEPALPAADGRCARRRRARPRRTAGPPGRCGAGRAGRHPVPRRPPDRAAAPRARPARPATRLSDGEVGAWRTGLRRATHRTACTPSPSGWAGGRGRRGGLAGQPAAARRHPARHPGRPCPWPAARCARRPPRRQEGAMSRSLHRWNTRARAALAALASLLALAAAWLLWPARPVEVARPTTRPPPMPRRWNAGATWPPWATAKPVTPPGAVRPTPGAAPFPFGLVYSSNLTRRARAACGAGRRRLLARCTTGNHATGAGSRRPFRTTTPLITRADSDALFAYLMSLPPVDGAPPDHALRWPYGTQAALKVWQALYFRPAEGQPPAPPRRWASPPSAAPTCARPGPAAPATPRAAPWAAATTCWAWRAA